MNQFFKSIVVFVLTLEAKAVLWKHKPKIVAVTGSVGKTATKDAIYAVLSDKFHVRKSEKSFNSELGLPLTILGFPNAWHNPLRWIQNIFDGLYLILLPTPYPEWLVLEVGADRPGDISSLARWLKVDVAVITRLPEVPVHVEFFDSPEAVVAEKASLLKALRVGGLVVLYGDDERVESFKHHAEKRNAEILTFGLSHGVDVKATAVEVLRESGKETMPLGMSMEVQVGGVKAPLSVLGVVGFHTILPALAATAVGVGLKLDLANSITSLQRYEPPHGRMTLLPGVKNTVVIDDSYNASPAAVVAALDTLASINVSGRKIAVLGDMLELGRRSVEEHRKIGAHVAKTADILVAVGFRSRDIAEGALDNGMNDANIFQYEETHRAGDELEAMLTKGDCVLVKGSQSMRMEKIVEMIMREPERASELLVRQEENWKKR